MFFLSLEMIGKPGPSIIGYRCVFLEEPSSVLIALPAVTSCTVGADENLWEIAGRYGVSPERLLELNSWIRDPFELKEGREVKLA